MVLYHKMKKNEPYGSFFCCLFYFETAPTLHFLSQLTKKLPVAKPVVIKGVYEEKYFLYFKYSLGILEKTFNMLNFICEVLWIFYKL